MAVIIDKTGRVTSQTDKKKTKYEDSNLNVYEWNVIPYNDLLDETLGGTSKTDLGGRARNITDNVGRARSITDFGGRITSITDKKQNSITLWDDTVITWDDAFYTWDGYRP
jgi:hypothetical protein